MSGHELPAIPAWEPEISRLIAAATTKIRLIGCATPLNWRAELSALEHDFERDTPRAARFEYHPIDTLPISDALLRAAEQLEARPTHPAHGINDQLKQVYLARLRELAIEAQLCATVGTEGFESLARKRYRVSEDDAEQAHTLSLRWLGDCREESPAPALIGTDDEQNENSLLCLMREAVGAHRLALRVVVSSRLSSLAATGPNIIYVAKGQALSVHAAKRTVLHEIYGHAMPRWRAGQAPLGIFNLGTASGSDDQEGRALVLEERANMMDPGRRLELARRNLACRSVRQGAAFVETVRLLRKHGSPLPDALRIGSRAHRGGGLARESVYLPAYLRTREALKRDSSLDHILAQGRVSLDAAQALKPWVPRADAPGLSSPPKS